MGLDSVIQYYDGNSYTNELPLEISKKFEPIKIYGIIGFGIKINKKYCYISFRGKAYNDVVKKLTSQSLYQDLEPDKLKQMYVELEKILNNYHDNNIEQIQKAYFDLDYDLTSWIELLTELYVPSPNEIIGLKEIFRICYENNLQLYSCY